MSFLVRSFGLFLLLTLFCLFPFFEGCETPLGLFLVHTIVVVAFCVVTLQTSRIHIPQFLIYFLPFLGSQLISTFIAPYKYSAVLQLWDYCIVGILIVAAFSIFQEHKARLTGFLSTTFLVGAIAVLITVALGWSVDHFRMKGSFANANDFASFTLLLIVLGCIQEEQEINRTRRTVMLALICALTIALAFASSRSAFLAAILFFVPYFWKRRASRKFVAAGAAILIVAGIVLSIRLTHFSDPFRYYRWKIWTNSLRGILQDPYLGIGLNMLPYKAPQFNFPANVEIGRYAKVASTADSQYLQVLAETGFLGLFTFLIGWFALYFELRNLPERLKLYRYFYYVISVIALFSLPLNNTAVVGAFTICTVFALAISENLKHHTISLGVVGRIGIAVGTFILFSAFVFLPFAADYEFRKALSAKNGADAQNHLGLALLLNPYQPYYRHSFVKRILEARPMSSPEIWLRALEAVNDSIRLNPLEADFYVSKADIMSILLDITGNRGYYMETLAAYQAAIDRSPFNVFLRSKYALFLSRSGRHDYAELQIRKALELEPVYLGARLLLARVEYEEGNLAGARHDFQELEKYQLRYKNYRPPEVYYKLLLQVDPQLKQEVKQLIFHDSQN